MIKQILKAICLQWLVDQQDKYVGLWREAQDAIKDAILKQDKMTTRTLQKMANKYLTMAQAIYIIYEDVKGEDNDNRTRCAKTT